MNLIKEIFLLLSFLTFSLGTQAQTEQTTVAQPTVQTYKIGICAPLFLDSISTKTKLLSTEQTAIYEFCFGAQLAFDSSLTSPNQIVKAYMVDSKQPQQRLLLQLDSLDLLIGNVKDADYTFLANYAKQKNSPFISATYPNSGGIENNPFVVILNGTLITHIEGMYNVLQAKLPQTNIIYCNKAGSQEKTIEEDFKTLNAASNSNRLPIRYVTIQNSFKELLPYLDSTKQNTIVGGSVDKNFAQSLCSFLTDTSLNLQNTTVIGMPNWVQIKGLYNLNEKSNFITIVFTTSYYNPKTSVSAEAFKSTYKQKFHVTPSDNAYKGFEAAKVFSNIYLNYPLDFFSHINDKNYHLFTDFNFKESVDSKNKPNYFENKHVYYVKIVDGKVSLY